LIALTAGLAISGSSLGQFSVQPQGQLADLPAGAQAIQALGDQLPAVAAANDFTPAELRHTLMTDHSLHVNPDNRLFYICPKADDQGDSGDGSDGPNLAGLGIPLDDFLNLSSNPGASKTLYLDFDGHHSVNNDWNHDITFPPYNTSGSSATFTDGEKSDIIKYWLEVAEDYKQFDINVTTLDPGAAALIKSNGSDQNFGIRCVMTQATGGFGNGIGGVAFLNTFPANVDDPCFAFNKGLGAGPQTASHECGHTFGLQHDGLNGQEYHPGSSGGGQSDWGPIMGAPFGRDLVQFSNGDYPGHTSTQDDFVVITKAANGVNKLPDDYTNDFFNGEPISPNTPITGVIGDRNDIDVFAMTVGNDDVQIDVTPNSDGPNLDILVQVYKLSPFQLVATIDQDNTPEAHSQVSLTAGDYAFVVDGTFQSLNNGPVSDYGSTGEYTINLDVVQPPAPIVITYPNGVPTEFVEGATTDILVNIDPGSHPLDQSELYMLYAFNFGIPLFRVDLVSQGGNDYTATMPAGVCDDSVVFNFTVNALDGTQLIDPPAPGAYNATVTCDMVCLPDVNHDGQVTAADFTAWVAAFNAGAPECDQNGDGSCTAADFTAWVANFNAGCP